MIKLLFPSSIILIEEVAVDLNIRLGELSPPLPGLEDE
jgi:hypothetical protein